ncbi:phosphatase [Leucobacter coleopterorum]|uniref:Phosphatase n=2 Tax=Leucobacter coleopterorum TaxID=2714933 RepID=A0ABX6JZB9_9MICO|nr:phosphatase [Leucobacter coleopterorum]
MAFIAELANTARAALSDHHRVRRFDTKDDASPVTEFDRAVEQMLRDRIHHRYPDHGIVGEEFAAELPDAEFVWIMDPIDGTKQFIAGIPVFTTLIALCHNGTPVVGLIDAPATDDRWLGVSGGVTTHNGEVVHTSGRTTVAGATVSWSNPEVVLDPHLAGRERLNALTAWRVFGAAAFGCGRLASGALDLAIESGTTGPHDVCALAPIIEAAGGKCSDGFGEPITLHSTSTFLAAATPELHAEALTTLNSDRC